MDRLLPSPAFPALAALPRGGADARLLVEARGGMGVARVMARKGAVAELRARVRTRFGLDLPDGPRFTANAGLSFSGVGPGAWLAVQEDAAQATMQNWADDLARDLDGAASVADQSGTYAILRLRGAAVYDVLASGAFIDFHPAVFEAGAVAVTTMALIDTIIWKRDDAPTFDIAVFRSFAPDFWRWLEETAAGWGADLARA